MKKKRETSKMLLWTVIALSAFFSLLGLAMCALWARDQFGMAITVVGGLWGASVPVAIGCYSDKAKAENEIKLSQNIELEALRAEMEAMRSELPKPKPPRKKPHESELVGQIRLLLEQHASDT